MSGHMLVIHIIKSLSKCSLFLDLVLTFPVDENSTSQRYEVQNGISVFKAVDTRSNELLLSSVLNGGVRQ